MTVIKWFVDNKTVSKLHSEAIIVDGGMSNDGQRKKESVETVVYLAELRVRGENTTHNPEYILGINIAIQDALGKGNARDWMDKIVRKWTPLVAPARNMEPYTTKSCFRKSSDLQYWNEQALGTLKFWYV